MMIKLLKNSGKRCLVLLLFALLPVGSLWAQGLEVEKPLILTSRQEAKTYERLDLNQVPCALLILHLNDDNVDFEGDIRTMQYRNNGEWWLWMIQGSNWLTVKSPKWSPLRLDFESLQSSKTYEMTLRPVMTLKLAITEPLRADISMQDASSTRWGRKDANGRTCALLRIGLVLPEAKFVGKWVVDSEYHDGEWYVWLSPDATQLTVTAEGYQALALEFDPVKASTTYVMTLLKEGSVSQRYKWEEVPEGFVDLGLPSSTLWAEDNWSDHDGETYHFEWDYFAERGFGPLIPSRTMLNELMTECKWTWVGKGYKVVGPNGNFIMLPADGFYSYEAAEREWAGATEWKGFPEEFGKVGAIWTSTQADRHHGWVGGFNKDTIAITEEFSMSDGLSLRLVLTPEIAQQVRKFNYPQSEVSSTAKHIYPSMMATSSDGKNYVEDDDVVELVISDDEEEHVVDLGVIDDDADYVDLGLPSGTKWKSSNQSGYYDYDGAVKAFGNSMPTVEQWHELKTKCRWEWQNNNAKVTGPNGKSIILSAEGYYDYEDGRASSSSSGYYWSRTPSHHGTSMYLRFNSYDEKVDMNEYNRGRGHSIRLVK